MNTVCPICKGDVSDGEDKVVLAKREVLESTKLVKKEKTA